jgi:hypothetical protein
MTAEAHADRQMPSLDMPPTLLVAADEVIE